MYILTLYILLLALLLHSQSISAHLIKKKTDNEPPRQILRWNSSPAFDTEFGLQNKLKQRSPQITFDQSLQKHGRLEKRVDLKCPWGWFQCQSNGEGGCCIVGSACKWNTATNSMGCWWSCENREHCGLSCCLSVHECVNGLCQLITVNLVPTVSNEGSNSTNGSTNSTGGNEPKGDGKSDGGGGWDSWKLAEKVGLIIGIVSGVASIGALLWCRKVRKRNDIK